ncbi:oligosaccharyltransferase complex/magnesium transporter family protein [Actinidia rufa]|uniref:Oligosaccharyltransferase complex/magnesium transporter family protein n=1 Tax=Actinidia rufa TaxID=165716 RepID=A0A7J0FZ42_9ERIC|nr:oligosaccharyltransferase complex/magnesium transporter family protein [Actinidia rufa]
MAISAAPLSLLLTLLFSLLSPSAPHLLRPRRRPPHSRVPIPVWRHPPLRPPRLPLPHLRRRSPPLLATHLLRRRPAPRQVRTPAQIAPIRVRPPRLLLHRQQRPRPFLSLSKLFFCDLEFRDAQSSFSLFGVNALPHIRLVPATARNLKDDSHQMDAGDLSRLAESMAQFVESKTKLTIGPIHRPPMVSKTQLTVLIAALLIWVPFVVKKLISGDTLLHDPKVLLAGSVFVYFFSVSGAMHNIIRNMPMFMADRNDPSKLVFFYQGSGMQLGAEGFAVGSLYTVVGLLLAFVTHVLVRVRNVTVQRLVMIVSLLVSFWAVKMVVSLDNWKTGYGIHMYWPSSWQ